MNAPKELVSPVDRIRGYHAELTDIRRDLHAHPELEQARRPRFGDGGGGRRVHILVG